MLLNLIRFDVLRKTDGGSCQDPMRKDSCIWQYEFEMMKGPYKSMYWIGKHERYMAARLV